MALTWPVMSTRVSGHYMLVEVDLPICKNPLGSGGNRVNTDPFVHSKCRSLSSERICGFSPGLWNSAKNPSWKIFVGMTGPLDVEASGIGAGGAGLGFWVTAALELSALAAAWACARAAAAASFVPKSSVNMVSRDDLRSEALAHLVGQL